jgi:argininosuccinate lyase
MLSRFKEQVKAFDLMMESAENIKMLLPGYTHLQIAMPSLGMWFRLCRKPY